MWLCVGVCVLFFHSYFCVSTAENRLEFQCNQVRMTEGDSEGQSIWEYMQESDFKDRPCNYVKQERE